jgi:hypothetical protein
LIPTVLLAAVIVGRWWAIPLLALIWPAIVFLAADCDTAGCAAGAAGLAALNAAVGVAVRLIGERLIRPAEPTH